MIDKHYLKRFGMKREDEFKHNLVKIGELMDEFDGYYYQAKEQWNNIEAAVESVFEPMFYACRKINEAVNLLLKETVIERENKSDEKSESN
jgi:hypothetical protein